MSKIQMNSVEIKATLNHIIKNNIEIQKTGKTPVAVSICGPAGLGKTSIIEQVAKENNIKHFATLNLAQVDEIGDITGYPCKEYFMVNAEQKGLYVDEKAVETYQEKGYTLTNNTRMSFAKPAWLAGKNESLILNLDDWSRAQPRFLQAVMQIIQKQEFISWKLPKGSHIIMSENPTDGTYDVTDVDDAFRSRFITLDLKFEPEVWAEWATSNGIDGRCISFVLLTPEIINPKTPKVNPRSLVLFFDTISSIDNFEKQLPLIQAIGEGCVGPEVTSMFTTFIHNKLDRIVHPSTIMDTTKNVQDILEIIQNLVKSGSDYRADLAYVLTQRLINYINLEVDQVKINSAFVQRVKELVTSNALGSDLRYVIVKKVIPNNKKFNTLYSDAEVVEMIVE